MGFIATNIDKICGKCNFFNPKCCTNEKLGLSLHSLTKTARTGAVVQLVRIHACHAWGRGFESRPHRRNPETKVSGFFVFRSISATLQHKILRESAKVGRAVIQTARCASKEAHSICSRHPDSTAIVEVHNVDPLSANLVPRPGHNAGTTRTATRCRCIRMIQTKRKKPVNPTSSVS